MENLKHKYFEELKKQLLIELEDKELPMHRKFIMESLLYYLNHYEKEENQNE